MVTRKWEAGKKKPNEMIKIKGRMLHRYAYRDTPKVTWREDRKTLGFVWSLRPLIKSGTGISASNLGFSAERPVTF